MWVLTLGRRDAHVSAADSVKVLEQSTLAAPSAQKSQADGERKRLQ